MDINNSDTGNPEKHSLPNGKGSVIVNLVDQMVKRKAKSEIVSCAIIKGSTCVLLPKEGALVAKPP